MHSWSIDDIHSNPRTRFQKKTKHSKMKFETKVGYSGQTEDFHLVVWVHYENNDGEGCEGFSKKMPQTSSMPWARNFHKYIGSRVGLNSEAFMELERKVLLKLFKER